MNADEISNIMVKANVNSFFCCCADLAGVKKKKELSTVIRKATEKYCSKLSVNGYFSLHSNSKICFDVMQCQIISSIKATMNYNN